MYRLDALAEDHYRDAYMRQNGYDRKPYQEMEQPYFLFDLTVTRYVCGKCRNKFYGLSSPEYDDYYCQYCGSPDIFENRMKTHRITLNRHTGDVCIAEVE